MEILRVPDQGGMMEVGSRAGYYTSKSPKMILHEWCNRANRPKPRYKAITTEDGRFRCKVAVTLHGGPLCFGCGSRWIPCASVLVRGCHTGSADPSQLAQSSGRPGLRHAWHS